MNTLTQTGQWEMRVDYQFNNKTWSHYHYNQFSVGSASEGYPLTVGGFTGEGTDWFAHHNTMKFSTPDNDNDHWNSDTCAAAWKSGWWYKICYHINANTQPPYYHHPNIAIFVEMKIRPRNCV
ncbi:fibrinogen-like protein A [Dysidea avara]|uniref:fibrinogen-like protein A n=1 Tax=Dysidea avara TaxID=196820 RepID=UPI003319BA0A